MSESFIPGIYNYCDRWCERCAFTSRCHTHQRTSDLSPGQNDITNKAFWENISFSFKEAAKLLKEAARENGIDLKMTQEESEQYETKRMALKKIINSHPIIQLTKRYQQLAMPFLKKSEGFVEEVRKLHEHLHLGIKSEEDVAYSVANINDCFEVVQWYLFFIDAKLQRALHGRLEHDESQAKNNFPKDSDGSAKIALTAIERSIGAWVKLYDSLSYSEDTALHVLSLLSQLLQKTKEEFPDAMNFVRPGFDE